MIRGAIFDADGTLFDSMFIWESIGEDYLRSIGYEPKERLNEVFKNMSLYQAACYYREQYGVPLSTDAIMDGVNAQIEKYYKYEIGLKPYTADFLERLGNMGVSMCIATATDRPYVEAALKRCGIRKYFSEIFTCTSVGHGKDTPVIYREAMNHLKTNKESTLVFEDALHAAQTAKNDGFLVAAVYDKYEKEQAGLKEIADVYLHDFNEWDVLQKFLSSLD